MELRLTINGNEKLPIDVEKQIANLLNDPNAEFSISIVCSPYPTGVPGAAKAADLKAGIRKVKALFVESIKIRT